MLPQFNSLQELAVRFSDDAVCRKYLEDMIWKGNPTCQHCGQNKPYKLKDDKTYRCSNKQCKKDFTITLGTVFESSKIGLSKWFMAIYMATNHKKGISSRQLAKDLNVRQRTAWFLLHRIREMIRPKEPPILKEEVLIDHTFVGGRQKNKSKFKRWLAYQNNGGKRVDDKQPVFALMEKNGPVLMVVVPDSKAETALPLMVDLIHEDTVIVSDGGAVFNKLEHFFKGHIVVNHSLKMYVNGPYTTNDLEAVFATLKRTIIGTYHQVSRKHLQRYCEEVMFRYNTRRLKDNHRFVEALSLAKGRLKYKKLVA